MITQTYEQLKTHRTKTIKQQKHTKLINCPSDNSFISFLRALVRISSAISDDDN